MNLVNESFFFFFLSTVFLKVKIVFLVRLSSTYHAVFTNKTIDRIVKKKRTLERERSPRKRKICVRFRIRESENVSSLPLFLVLYLLGIFRLFRL